MKSWLKRKTHAAVSGDSWRASFPGDLETNMASPSRYPTPLSKEEANGTEICATGPPLLEGQFATGGDPVTAAQGLILVD
ncbi:hypothetical protein BgiMline_026437 [Biomphalaria glabrata]|nr:hypothetical protein BgiMline_020921 [Biomphalaria glabrata]